MAGPKARNQRTLNETQLDQTQPHIDPALRLRHETCSGGVTQKKKSKRAHLLGGRGLDNCHAKHVTNY